jgi:hypothetical protein
MAQVQRATSSGGKQYLQSGIVVFDDIEAKTLKLGGLDNGNGSMQVYDNTGAEMVTVDNLGVTLSNGAKLIGADGVLNEFIFSNDWQTLGWVNDGGTGVNFNCSMSIFIPDDIQVLSAILYVDIASRYITDPLDLTTIVDGYYSPTNIKLYTSNNTPKIYLDYPVDSSTNLITSETGTLNTDFGTWNPTAAETIQIKSLDLISKIVKNSRFLIKLTGGVASPSFNQLYTDGGMAKMELVVIGYKQ